MLLTLDLATNIGWTLGAPADQQFQYGSYKLPSTGNDIGLFLEAYDNFLNDKIRKNNVTKIGFEAPIFPKISTPATMRKLVGLCSHTEFRARSFGKVGMLIEVVEANRTAILKELSIRQFSRFEIKKPTERRKRNKIEVRNAMAKLGYRTDDDDMADAIALRLFVIRHEYRDVKTRVDLGLLGVQVR